MVFKDNSKLYLWLQAYMHAAPFFTKFAWLSRMNPKVRFADYSPGIAASPS